MSIKIDKVSPDILKMATLATIAVIYRTGSIMANRLILLNKKWQDDPPNYKLAAEIFLATFLKKYLHVRGKRNSLGYHNDIARELLLAEEHSIFSGCPSEFSATSPGLTSNGEKEIVQLAKKFLINDWTGPIKLLCFPTFSDAHNRSWWPAGLLWLPGVRVKLREISLPMMEEGVCTNKVLHYYVSPLQAVAQDDSHSSHFRRSTTPMFMAFLPEGDTISLQDKSVCTCGTVLGVAAFHPRRVDETFSDFLRWNAATIRQRGKTSYLTGDEQIWVSYRRALALSRREYGGNTAIPDEVFLSWGRKDYLPRKKKAK